MAAGGLGATMATQLAASVAAFATDRPIVMPDGTLFAWMRTIANGETQLVLNELAQECAAA